MKKRILGFILVMLMIAVSSYAEDLKIGVIDMDYVLKNSREVLNGKGKLREKFTRLQDDLRAKEKVLKESMDEFEKQNALYSEEAKKEKQANLKEEEEKLVATFKSYQEDIKKNEQELVKGVIDQVKEISKNEGYSFVIEKNSGMVIFSKDELDISKKMISILDKTAAEGK